MTKEELDFWGTPPYQCTLTNKWGHPIGTIYPDGTITYLPASNIGSKDRDGNTVVWNGTKTNSFDRTKGRLLPIQGPRYIDSTTVFQYLATEEAKYDDVTGETQTTKTPKGNKRNAKVPTKRDRAKGKSKTKGAR